jgi:putative nucleotidyltransferase with HDIG domain
MSDLPAREEAVKLFKQYNETESLYKHALSVEAVMRHFAKKYGEDEEYWSQVGLLHDLDYEKYPEEHCDMTARILRENNYPDEFIRAVLSHGFEICTDVEPHHTMEKVLYATDELTGLITATALVRPSRSVLDMKAKSVKKKWKDKSFSAGVNREVIEKGAAMLGVELSDLITETIEGMKTAAKEIGLEGDV